MTQFMGKELPELILLKFDSIGGSDLASFLWELVCRSGISLESGGGGKSFGMHLSCTK